MVLLADHHLMLDQCADLHSENLIVVNCVEVHVHKVLCRAHSLSLVHLNEMVQDAMVEEHQSAPNRPNLPVAPNDQGRQRL